MSTEKNTEDVIIKQGPDKSHESETAVTKQDNTTKADAVDFDDLLSAAGELGRYQLLLFFSTFPFYVFYVCVYYTQVFLTEVAPNHWCWVPELENLTDIERRNLAIPLDEQGRFGYSRCEAYDANWTEVLVTGIKPNDTWTKVPCKYGWEFNKTEIPYPTISSEMSWVCDRDSYQATAQSVFFIGSIIGGFTIGWVADKFGRLKAAMISNMIGCIGGIASMFATNFLEFAVCRFFTGLAHDNCMVMVYLIVLEYVAPKYRSFMANASFGLFFSFAVTALPWVALACGHWKTISLVTSLPMILAIFSPLFIPESSTWLLSKGRTDEAVKKILKISRINKKDIPTNLIEQFKSTIKTATKKESKSLLDLLRRPVLRKAFILMCLEYICCALVFDSIVRGIGSISYDFFISFTVISVTEFPSVILLAFIMDWLGRRWLVTITLILCCLFRIISVLVGGGFPSLMCVFVARFMVNMAYSAALQWSAEILPTPVRGSGVSVIHICGFVGTFLSPLISYLDIVAYWLPALIVGCVALFGALWAFFLPETAKRQMPQTFHDAEKIFKNQKYFDFYLLSKKQKNNNR